MVGQFIFLENQATLTTDSGSLKLEYVPILQNRWIYLSFSEIVNN